MESRHVFESQASTVRAAACVYASRVICCVLAMGSAYMPSDMIWSVSFHAPEM